MHVPQCRRQHYGTKIHFLSFVTCTRLHEHVVSSSRHNNQAGLAVLYLALSWNNARASGSSELHAEVMSRSIWQQHE